MTHSLVLGDLDLDERFPQDDGYSFAVLADGMSFGVAQGVKEIVTSLLADGELSRTTRYGNRDVTFAVEIEGPDLGSVALGEAALRREVGRPNTLTWTAPDLFAAATVFEVVDSSMSQTFNDLDELRRKRTFEVTLTCAPFARSADLTVIEPLEVSATAESVVDTCDSATGWTATVNGVAATVDMGWSPGAVSVIEVLNPAPQTLALKRTGAVSFASARYLVAEIGYNMSLGQLPVTLAVPGVAKMLPTSVRLLSAGWYEYTWDMTSAPSPASLTFSSYTTTASADLKIRELRKGGAPPSLASRQTTRNLYVGGTERTPASIHVEAGDGTSDLGLAIVSTYPGRYPEVGFHPAMSRWYTSGTRTVDATSVSGYRFRLDNGFFVSTAPASSFPIGGYQMVSLLAASVEGDYEVASLVQTRKAGVILKEWVNNEVVHLFNAPNWALVDMGVPTLPILDAESGTDVVLAVKVRQVNGADLVGVTVEAQDAWMLPVDDDCGLEVVLTDKANLWMDSPTTASAVPRVLEGDSPDRTGATFPLRGARAGTHVLSPGLTGITVITTVAQNPRVTTSYYKRWHSNAAE